MELCSADYLALVGVISAIIHIGVRGLINMYPRQDQLLLNLMMLVNVLLLVYFGWCLFRFNKDNKKND